MVFYESFDKNSVWNRIYQIGEQKTFPGVADFPEDFTIPRLVTLNSYTELLDLFTNNFISKTIIEKKEKIAEIDQIDKELENRIASESTKRLKWLFILIPILQVVLELIKFIF